MIFNTFSHSARSILDSEGKNERIKKKCLKTSSSKFLEHDFVFCSKMYFNGFYSNAFKKLLAFLGLPDSTKRSWDLW